MACGRAAFVYDAYGYEGWVTSESYGRLEARGFDGVGSNREFGVEALREDLERLSP